MPMPFNPHYERPSMFPLTAQESAAGGVPGNMTPGGYSITSQPIAVLASNGILYGVQSQMASRQMSAASRISNLNTLSQPDMTNRVTDAVLEERSHEDEGEIVSISDDDQPVEKAETRQEAISRIFTRGIGDENNNEVK
jgi:hypothetical protein